VLQVLVDFCLLLFVLYDLCVLLLFLQLRLLEAFLGLRLLRVQFGLFPRECHAFLLSLVQLRLLIPDLVFIVEPLQCLLLLLQLVLLPLLLALQLEVGQFVVDLLEHVFDAHVLVLALCEQFERFFTGLVLDTSACHLL